MATRPFPTAPLLAELQARIRTRLGEGALVEAACAAGNMEKDTKCVDLSGKIPYHSTLLSAARFLLTVVGLIFSLFYRSR